MVMMASLRQLASLGVLSSLTLAAQAATVQYDFSIGWVTVNPDGDFDRRTIGVNGQWPLPTIRASVGDRVIVNVKNDLGDQDTSLHFHGLFMNGTNHMDGPVGVTQCPIAPGGFFVYDFIVDQPGTYWYHSHSKGQYPDGLRAPLIVDDPEAPFEYDEEIVVSLSDWYHEQMTTLMPRFMNKVNPTGAEPVPNSALMNDSQDLKISVEPGKTYLFRMVNMAAFASQYVWFEGHDVSIVEVDGVYTKPATASMLYLSAGQRYSFLLKTRKHATENFAMVGYMDTTLFDVIPDDLKNSVTGWLVYNDDEPLPEPQPVDEDELEPFDDMRLVPYDMAELLPEPPADRIIHLVVKMDNLGDGANYAFFNNITYRAPKVPTLYTALSAGELATNPLIYGSHTNVFVLEKGEVVQIVLDNGDDGRHPFHLHGHQFQAVYRGKEGEGAFADSGVTDVDLPQYPVRRDTLVAWPNSNIVLRFKADNAGIWLFHCHIEWHVDSGLIATMVEAPLELQAQITLPQDHLDACARSEMPTRGNAAANTDDFMDLTGENAPPPPLPDGFTMKGIIALIISCLSGILGVTTIARYGLAQVEPSDDEGNPGAPRTAEEQPLLVPNSEEGQSSTTTGQQQPVNMELRSWARPKFD